MSRRKPHKSQINPMINPSFRTASLVSTAFFLVICASSSAQTPSNIEAAEYDSEGNRWFISNNSSLLETSDGGSSYAYFGAAIATHGMEALDGHLFALGANVIRAYNLETAELVGSHSIPGAAFLNGMGSRPGELVVSDFSSGKLHRVNVSDPTNMYSTVLINNTGTTPNGVVIDEANDRAVIVNWGSSAPILAVDLSTEELSTVVANTGLGNLDGIDMDGEGRFYVSSWSPARITRYSNDFSTSESVVQGAGSGLANPADISYSLETDTLGVANSGNGIPSFHFFGSTSEINSTPEWHDSVFWDGQQLHMECHISGDWNLSAYSATGQLIDQQQLTLPAAPVTVTPERLGWKTGTAHIWNVVTPTGQSFSVRPGPRQW